MSITSCTTNTTLYAQQALEEAETTATSSEQPCEATQEASSETTVADAASEGSKTQQKKADDKNQKVADAAEPAQPTLAEVAAKV